MTYKVKSDFLRVCQISLVFLYMRCRFLNAAAIPKAKKTKNSHGVVPNFLSRKYPARAPIPTARAMDNPTVLKKPKVLMVFFRSSSILYKGSWPYPYGKTRSCLSQVFRQSQWIFVSRDLKTTVAHSIVFSIISSLWAIDKKVAS
jgi:hypothetical protein